MASKHTSFLFYAAACLLLFSCSEGNEPPGPIDNPPLRDGEVEADAGPDSDATVDNDSGIDSDASAQLDDAGSDATSTVDAGVEADAEVEADADLQVDAEVAVDAGSTDPEALCDAFSAAVCARGRECVNNDAALVARLAFCSRNCDQLNAEEREGFSRDIEGLQACIDSIANADCDPDADPEGFLFNAIIETDACADWAENQ